MLTADDQRGSLRRTEIASLILILVVGLTLRLIALNDALNSPGYRWDDPDGYRAQALRLAGPNGWSWTFDAVTYTINGQRHALPPLYSVFLSFFALWPGFPLSAQIAQIVLAVVALAIVFALGRRLHSTRAGLIAAAIVTLWVPNIFGVWSTSQVPNSLRSWPDYGMTWPSIFNRSSRQFSGAAGLNVPAFDGLATLTATPAGSSPVRLRVRIGGVHVRTTDLPAGEASTIRTRWPLRGLAFVELDEVGPGDGAIVEVRVPNR